MKKAVPCFGAVGVSMALKFNGKAGRGKGVGEARDKNARSLQTSWTTAVQRRRGAKWKTDFSSGGTNPRLVTVRNCTLAVKSLASLQCNDPKSYIFPKILPRITRITRIQITKSASSALSAVNSAFGCGLAALRLCVFALRLL